MTKERGVIICLIIVAVMILMMLASSEKQLNEVRSKQFEYRALIEKNAGISDSQLYKQAGNAVTVDVVKYIAEKIYSKMKGFS